MKCLLLPVKCTSGRKLPEKISRHKIPCDFTNAVKNPLTSRNVIEWVKRDRVFIISCLPNLFFFMHIVINEKTKPKPSILVGQIDYWNGHFKLTKKLNPTVSLLEHTSGRVRLHHSNYSDPIQLTEVLQTLTSCRHRSNDFSTIYKYLHVKH